MDMYSSVFLLLLIAPWIVWWRVVDRSRIFEILIFGLFVSTIVVLLDTIGVHNRWWAYDSKFIQSIPYFVPMDYAVLPVSYMLTYQLIDTWSKYIFAAIILSSIGAYIVEPLFIHFEIYNQLKWRHSYSFWIYFFMALVLKYIVERLKQFATFRPS